MSEEIFRIIIYLPVIMLMPINVLAAAKLWRIKNHLDIKALNERAYIAVILAASSLFASIFCAARLTGQLDSPSYVTIFFIGISMVLASIPAVYWMWSFRGDE